MATVSAETVSLQGDKYIGTPYSKMDCQAFVEKCMADAGLDMNLAGSNAWYRECIKNGWIGTPEECRKTFGSIPKGAFLFIVERDGGEVKRGYRDGLGNASHIGLYTGRVKGAIHSSSSRGCVADSTFVGKTIPNGGWNTVGLWKRLSYGETIDRKLQGGDNVGILDELVKAIQGKPQTQATTATDLQPTTATDLGQTSSGASAQTSSGASAPPSPKREGLVCVVTAEKGNTVKVREKAGGATKGVLKLGTEVVALEEVTRSGVKWTRIQYVTEGWMMSKHLTGKE